MEHSATKKNEMLMVYMENSSRQSIIETTEVENFGGFFVCIYLKDV